MVRPNNIVSTALRQFQIASWVQQVAVQWYGARISRLSSGKNLTWVVIEVNSIRRPWTAINRMLCNTNLLFLVWGKKEKQIRKADMNIYYNNFYCVCVCLSICLSHQKSRRNALKEPIAFKEMRLEVYHNRELLQQLLSSIDSHEKEVYAYFKANYCNCLEQWASCFMRN